VLSSINNDYEAILESLASLFTAVESADIKSVIELLSAVVPEFTPKYSFSGTPPFAFQKVRPDLFPPATQRSKTLD